MSIPDVPICMWYILVPSQTDAPVSSKVNWTENSDFVNQNE